MDIHWLSGVLVTGLVLLGVLMILSRLAFLLLTVSWAGLALVRNLSGSLRLGQILRVNERTNDGRCSPVTATNMATRIEQHSDTVRVIPAGDINLEEAESMKTAVSGLGLSGKKTVIFDLRNVGYIGSAGLGKLLLFYKRLSSEKIHVEIQSASPAVKGLLSELRLDTLFKIT
jgi:anti-sigma B factor antagonist